MLPPVISFRLVPKVRQGHRRAVGILEGSSDLCAEILLNLPAKDTKHQWHSMDRWASGVDGPQGRSHRFDGTDYFVFKDLAKQHRFYGFLCHPLLNTDGRFHLCVLTTYAQKKEDGTDKAELERVKAWMNAPAAKAAIKIFYPDIPPEKDKQ